MSGFVCGAGSPGFADHDCEGADYCCFGAASREEPEGCTCWEPVYDLEQRYPITPTPPGIRSTPCADCAYRPDSPERVDEYEAEQLLALPLGVAPFYCHQGIRRPAEWRHPDGCTRPGDQSDYRPPIVENVPYRADGSPAEICAGWAQRAERAGRA